MAARSRCLAGYLWLAGAAGEVHAYAQVHGDSALYAIGRVPVP